MGRHAFPLYVALLALLAYSPFLQAAEDAGAGYALIYQNYVTGEKLEAEGRLQEAAGKYKAVESALARFANLNPGYAPVAVNYRLSKTRESILRVEAAASGSGAAGTGPIEGELPLPDEAPVRQRAAAAFSLPASAAPVPDVPALGQMQPAGPYRIPLPETAQPPASPIQQFAPATEYYSSARERYPGIETAVPGAVVQALRDEIDALRRRGQQAEFRLAQANAKLAQTSAKLQSALTEVDRTKVAMVELKSKLAQSQQAIEDGKSTLGHVERERDAALASAVALKQRLTETQAEVEVAEEHGNDLFAKLESASKYIKQSDQIREGLLSERKTLAADNRPASKKDLRRITAENGDLKSRLDDAIAKLKTYDAKEGLATRLASEKQGLQARLDDAEKKIADLTGALPEKDRMISDLRAQLASANDQIAAVQKELKTGRGQLGEIEKQLEDSKKAALAVTSDPGSIEENALLRDLVMRQLHEQTKRQQARKLVEEELRRMQIKSVGLIEKIDRLAGGSVSLSNAEIRALQRPLATGSSGGDSSLNLSMAVPKFPDSGSQPSDAAANDLPPSLQAQAAAANSLSKDGKLEEAESAYAELVEKAPNSFFARVNLGVLQLKNGKNSEAKNTIVKALGIRHDDPFGLTHLGIAEYRLKDFEPAGETLHKAISVDSSNYMAHYYLGLVMNAAGRREEAMKSLERAVQIKPDLGQAHLNMALICATQEPPLKEEARQHYQKATALGARPDSSIEQLIH